MLTFLSRDTDYKSWIRLESGRRSNPGLRTEKQTALGTFYWKPDDFCGWFRKAEYWLKDGEFTFTVEYGTKCLLSVDENGQTSGSSLFTCSPVARCTTGGGCVAGATAALLASLLGGSG